MPISKVFFLESIYTKFDGRLKQSFIIQFLKNRFQKLLFQITFLFLIPLFSKIFSTLIFYSAVTSNNIKIGATSILPIQKHLLDYQFKFEHYTLWKYHHTYILFSEFWISSLVFMRKSIAKNMAEIENENDWCNCEVRILFYFCQKKVFYYIFVALQF